MAALDASRAVLTCARPANGDDELSSGWRRPGPCRTGPRSWRFSSTSARSVQRGLRMRWWGGRTSGPRPEGWRRPGPCRAGLHWRSGPSGRGALFVVLPRLFPELTQLLSSLNSFLKDHFNGVELQMRVTRGEDAVGGNGPAGCAVGWRTFFEVHAWRSTMEVEDLSTTPWLPTAAPLRCTSAKEMWLHHERFPTIDGHLYIQ